MTNLELLNLLMSFIGLIMMTFGGVIFVSETISIIRDKMEPYPSMIIVGVIIFVVGLAMVLGEFRYA